MTESKQRNYKRRDVEKDPAQISVSRGTILEETMAAEVGATTADESVANQTMGVTHGAADLD